MSTISNYRPFQIIGDGKKLAIVMEDGVYVFDDCYTKAFSMCINANLIDVTSLSGYKEFAPGLKTFDITLDLIANKAKYEMGSFDLIGDRIKSMTVLELFRVINQKLNSR